jgi:hypothetical protein
MGAQKYQPKREGQIRPFGGEASKSSGRVRQVTAASEKSNPITATLMEKVVRRENLTAALKRCCFSNYFDQIFLIKLTGECFLRII